ncbi:MAG: PilN domain-containing protein [Planctomycetota bacterium]|jgi:Tfp pilus assembly protein PilN
MLNINFVPDDYVQNSESRRTNLMYLVLLAIVMAALGGSFVTIKIRQRALSAKEEFVNAKLAQTEEAIKQFERLQVKRKAMMKTALTTAELLEPVARSVLLASLTNNLPAGVSLLRLNLVQKQPKRTATAAADTKYQKAQADKAKAAQPAVSREKLLETHIDIEGIAPSDRQVAAYIESLGSSSLLDSVALVESKERKIEDTVFRQFKLKARLGKDLHLTKQDVERIRARAERGVRVF